MFPRIQHFKLEPTTAATPVNEWTLWPRTVWCALKERKTDCGMPAFHLFAGQIWYQKKEHFLGLRLQRACWRYENCEIDEVIWLAETAGRSAGRRDSLTPWIRCTSFHFASQDPPIKSRIKARNRHIYPPLKTNISPVNWWLEDEMFLSKWSLVRGHVNSLGGSLAEV